MKQTYTKIIEMLQENEYHPYYGSYVKLSMNMSNDIVTNLKNSLSILLEAMKNLAKEKQEYAYDEGKWTIKELLQHMIDTERVFSYRAMRFARNDKTALSGFDQDEYGAVVDANRRSFDAVLDEFTALRQSTIYMFESFTPEEQQRVGEASGSDTSVRALGFIMSGHVLHHLNVINERYL